MKSRMSEFLIFGLFEAGQKTGLIQRHDLQTVIIVIGDVKLTRGKSGVVKMVKTSGIGTCAGLALFLPRARIRAVCRSAEPTQELSISGKFLDSGIPVFADDEISGIVEIK